ncbi:SnoaL-like polyketide cyclase [Paenibacillus algorifonticola]|uniref:SnoaL-like polyketide cyclase n=1 Tax=Paenibacillus algorifonticola TaxID=684063 RepID=A0A1I2AA57_9BACL|nr:ester cyclase [Paenibacillus algorifonticola]SFE40649.1 SnoaL-like polyketide cyclase [Paenibacillus algorifonticola]
MTAAQVVRDFFEKVRSGKELDAVHEVMAERVLAHQVQSEKEVTVERSPADYADHVREMIESYGAFSLTVEHFLAQENEVYVRWKQVGAHLGEIDGFAPTGKPVIEIASAVYRVEAGKIAEYWIQIDREGIRVQLERNAKLSVAIQASEEGNR